MAEIIDPITQSWHITDKPEQEIPVGIQKIGAKLEWELSGTMGEYSSVCVIDTGTPNHPDLKVEDSLGGDDKDGHATHVAGTICADGKIKGVAPKAKLYTANFEDYRISECIEWAIEKDVDVINMSFRSGESASVKRAIEKATEKGIICVGASGNSGDHGVQFPATHPDVIATGAIRENRDKTFVSSVGEEVEIVALGFRVESTYLNEGYHKSSGTSMACPHIAGAIALMQSKNKMLHGKRLTLEQVRAILHSRAINLGEKGRDKKFGYGLFSFNPNIQEELEIKMWPDKTEYKVNGETREMDTQPTLKDGRTLVPIRFIAETFGANVNWDSDKREITITK